MKRKIILLALLVPALLAGSERKIKTLYSSLDPHSIAQQLSFYELYPDTNEGKQALRKAWQLLAGVDALPDHLPPELAFNASAVQGIVSLVNKQANQELPELTDAQLATIGRIANRLHNRKLRGSHALSEEDVLQLASDQIDISRAVLLSQTDEQDSLRKVQSYEAMIDLMALQILARLPSAPTPESKIRAINTFIFQEMGFRFPPHSKYAQDVDLYTFLPSVLDSRHGVCLGVSILYLSIAQRLDLPLEVVTPPGHIYIRYREGSREINIETTARGIHIDSEDYLGVDTRELQQRELREVPGLAHINHAAVFLKDEKYAEALECYQKALPYLRDDKLLMELMGYCCLFTGEKEQGRALLRKVAEHLPDHCVAKGTMAEDFLAGKADVDAIRAVFLSVDETRESILAKKAALEEAVQRCPEFREGWQNLGIAWLQLHRSKEALKALEQSYSLDSGDPTNAYYLAALHAGRMDFKKSWKHLYAAEEITSSRGHHPKALKYLRRQLAMASPE